MIQVVSIAGALLILLAYAANQGGRMGPSDLSYSLFNLLGAATLTVVAAFEEQYGFLLLEGVWTAVSLWAVARLVTRPA